MDSAILTRRCFRCKQDKPLTLEHYCRSRSDKAGFGRPCKMCAGAIRNSKKAYHLAAGRKYQRSVKGNIKRRLFARQYQKDHKEAVAARRRQTQRSYRKRTAERDREKLVAEHKVQYAVYKGRIIKPSSCQRCGKCCRLGGHHYLGYAPEHWYDIEWLCDQCHAFCHHPLPEGATSEDIILLKSWTPNS